MELHLAMQICNMVGIKVFGLKQGASYYVGVEEKGEETFLYTKKLDSDESLNQAVTDTYIYYANRAIDKSSLVEMQD